jgi:hypothetical protein
MLTSAMSMVVDTAEDAKMTTKQKLASYRCEKALHLLSMLNEAEEKLNKLTLEDADWPNGFSSPWNGSCFISGCFCQNAYDEDEEGNCTTQSSCQFCLDESQRNKLQKEILHIYELCRNFLKKNK